MKKISRAGLLAAVAFAAFAAAATPARAVGDAAPAKIAVVDLLRILRDSKAGKDLNAQAEAKRKKLLEQFKAKQAEADAARKELDRKSSVMNKDAFQAEVKKYREQELKVAKDLDEKKNAMDKQVAEALEQINKATLTIVTEMAEKDQIDLVLNKQQVVMVRKTLDLTPEVVAQLDKALPKVQMK